MELASPNVSAGTEQSLQRQLTASHPNSAGRTGSRQPGPHPPDSARRGVAEHGDARELAKRQQHERSS